MEDETVVLWERQQSKFKVEAAVRMGQHLIQVRVQLGSEYEVVSAWIWSPTSRRWNWFTSLWELECACTGYGSLRRKLDREPLREEEWREDVEKVLSLVRLALIGDVSNQSFKGNNWV